MTLPQEYFNSFEYLNNNFIHINKVSLAVAECAPSSDPASGAGCGEGFESDDEVAAEAGGAAEDEEHLEGVGAPHRRHVALACPRTWPDPLRKHASGLS